MAIVIAGTREDWPRGARTLTPHDPTREPNGRTLWFGAELDPDGSQVWFRIDEYAIGRMPEKTPAARGDRLIDALIVWITTDRPLEPGINRFEVRVSEAGDTWTYPASASGARLTLTGVQREELRLFAENRPAEG